MTRRPDLAIDGRCARNGDEAVCWCGRPAQAAHARGELLLAGALADPYDRALLVFAGDGPGIAEEFARNDPYVINGLVVACHVRQWNEVLADS